MKTLSLLLAVFYLLLCRLQLTSSRLNGEAESQQSMAKHYFEYANELLLSGDVNGSLPLFRAAVRLDPSSSSLYHVKLAQVEHLLGDERRALKRNLKALSIQPDYEDALQYMKMNAALVRDLIETDTDARGKKYFQQLVRVEALSEKTNPLLDEPFFLKDAVKDVLNWFSTDKHSSLNASFDALDFFKVLYPHAPVETYPQNNNLKPPHAYFRNYKQNLSDVADFILFPDTAYGKVDASLSGTYAHWNTGHEAYLEILNMLNATKDFESNFNLDISKSLFTDCLANYPSLSSELSSKLHWFMVLLSEKAGGMFFHKDEISLSSWQAQLQGSKAWLICPPISAQVGAIIDSIKSPKYESGLDSDVVELLESADFEYDDLVRNLTSFVESIYDIIDFYGVCPLCSDVDFDHHAIYSSYLKTNMEEEKSIESHGIELDVRETTTPMTSDDGTGAFCDDKSRDGASTAKEGGDDKINIIRNHYLALPAAIRNILFSRQDSKSSKERHYDFTNFSNFNGVVTCYTAIVPPMSLIFYPRGYYHQTYNLDTPSVAVSSSLLRREDLQYFLHDIRSECDAHFKSPSSQSPIERNKYGFSSELCVKLMNDCFSDYTSVSD